MRLATRGMALLGLMSDRADHVESIMQWLSASATARRIDRLVGDLSADSLAEEPVLTYLRYNVLFEQKWMTDELGMNYEPEDFERLGAIDDLRVMGELWNIGEEAATQQMEAAHLPGTFDV